VTAFDTAWSVLKAPLLPETVDIDPKTRTGSAMFQFREGEVPLHLDGRLENNQIPLRIQPPSSPNRPETEVFVDLPTGLATFEEMREDPESHSPGYARFHEIAHGYTGNDTMPVVSDGYEGRGIGTALYDLMQMLLNARGKGESIAPSSGQTPEGMNMWRKALGREPLYYDEHRQMADWQGEVWPYGGALR
tara:strand:+ start:658 stop:1230 length:573 start_codon:yes stop_codon:yes gene_type:complete